MCRRRARSDAALLLLEARWRTLVLKAERIAQLRILWSAIGVYLREVKKRSVALQERQ